MGGIEGTPEGATKEKQERQCGSVAVMLRGHSASPFGSHQPVGRLGGLHGMGA